MPRKTDPLYDSFGALSPRAPTPLENLASLLSRMAYGNDDRAGTQNMLGILGSSPNRTPERRLVDMLNPLATIDAAYNSGQDIGNGKTLAGILGLGAAALPIPAKHEIGPVFRRLKKVFRDLPDEGMLASRSSTIYNPKPLPQRVLGWIILTELQAMRPDDRSTTSTTDRLIPERLSWAERMSLEATPEYQRKHMSSLRRKQRADALRRLRKARSEGMLDSTSWIETADPEK